MKYWTILIGVFAVVAASSPAMAKRLTNAETLAFISSPIFTKSGRFFFDVKSMIYEYRKGSDKEPSGSAEFVLRKNKITFHQMDDIVAPSPRLANRTIFFIGHLGKTSKLCAARHEFMARILVDQGNTP